VTEVYKVSRRDLMATVAAVGAFAASARALAAAEFPPSTRQEPLIFAKAEIVAAARAARTAEPAVTFSQDAALGGQAYRIQRAGGALEIVGGDVIGAMYGGLAVAEALRLGDGAVARVADGRVHTPHIAQRGIKFNIPLDLRTPTYSGWSDSATANVPEVWSREFWSAYFDEMAKHRYNVLSLWNLHPFPSLVKVPEFPDVALNDVWRSRNTIGKPWASPTESDAPTDYEVVKTLTIDQKISFWREVMQMAADRGISVYLFTWNVFVSGVDGKYGITKNMSNKTTVAYTRASVRELLKTYPLLAGIGLTPGEAMVNNNPDYTQEGWLWATYGEGIRDALKETPQRDFKLIHRLHQTTVAAIDKAWSQYPGFPETLTYSVDGAVADTLTVGAVTSGALSCSVRITRSVMVSPASISAHATTSGGATGTMG